MKLGINEKISIIKKTIKLASGITLDRIYTAEYETRKNTLIPMIYIVLYDTHRQSVTIPLNPNNGYIVCSLSPTFVKEYITNIDLIIGIVQ